MTCSDQSCAQKVFVLHNTGLTGSVSFYSSSPRERLKDALALAKIPILHTKNYVRKYMYRSYFRSQKLNFLKLGKPQIHFRLFRWRVPSFFSFRCSTYEDFRNVPNAFADFRSLLTISDVTQTINSLTLPIPPITARFVAARDSDSYMVRNYVMTAHIL